jgi:hypothetical protein
MEPPVADDELRRRDNVLRAFIDEAGRLRTIPARRAKRLIVLDHLAQLFEPGRRFEETEVNRRLRDVHEDVAALRRHLVDDGFLTRDRGVYWRSGGSVDLGLSAGDGAAGAAGAGGDGGAAGDPRQ